MKILFDQNISVRIVDRIKDIFPNCSQVRLEGLENATDLEIWNYARENDFSIVSFDADFYDLSVLRGQLPKIIWLRIGNTSTKELEEKLRLHSKSTLDLISNEQAEDSCLEVK